MGIGEAGIVKGGRSGYEWVDSRDNREYETLERQVQDSRTERNLDCDKVYPPEHGSVEINSGEITRIERVQWDNEDEDEREARRTLH